MNAPDSTTTKAAAGRGACGSRVNLHPIMELPETIMRTTRTQNLLALVQIVIGWAPGEDNPIRFGP